MKCMHCGSEWTARGESSQQMNHCPFCGKQLLPESKPAANPENLEDCLRSIHARFGLKPFREGKVLMGIHSDLMPGALRDRRLIGHFVDCEGHSLLEAALKKPKAEQSTALSRLVKRMYEEWLIREDAAKRICAIWWEILGGAPEAAAVLGAVKMEAPVPTAAKTLLPVCNSDDFEIAGTVLKKYKGTDPAIRLPGGIVTVDMNAFSGCETLKEVVIPDGVETIDVQAFFRCENLEKVTLPGTLKTVGYASFRDCGNLRAVTLPEGLRHIEDYAFKNCTRLERVEFPEELGSLGYEAFQNCTALQSVTLPRNLKILTGCAFWGCKNLQKVTLPENLQSAGDYTFAHCDALEEIRLPGSLDRVCGNMFLACSSLRYAELAPGVRAIGAEAFKKCAALKTLVIPDSVKEIHVDAFKECGAIAVQASAGWKKENPELLTRIPQ